MNGASLVVKYVQIGNVFVNLKLKYYNFLAMAKAFLSMDLFCIKFEYFNESRYISFGQLYWKQ